MERVGIYNRCSTEEESQRNALAVQAAESREIAEKKGWIIAEQYIESETGTVVCKRCEYQKLLADMEQDRFDIVMIKSIDRLARSARDWYFFLSRLTENKLRLYIYMEGKYYTPDDNLISGIKAILAEDFSRELSKKIKNAHKRRQEKKSGLNITCEMYGWNKLKKDCYELNQEEAEYYRTAFRLAKEGKGFYSISNIMYELGARSRRGQKISEVQWRKMLYTPRAHGTVVLNTRAYNFDMKRYEKVPEENWIYVENALPPVVSREYQEEVLQMLSHRAAFAESGENGGKKIRCSQKYALSHKLLCASCGGYYYRTGNRGNKKGEAVWKCSTFLKNGRTRGGVNLKGCDNPNRKEGEVFRQLEWELREELEREFSGYARGSLGGEEVLFKELMEVIEKALKAGDGEKELKRLAKERKKAMDKKEVLMEKLLSGVVGDEEFQRYNEELSEKIKVLNTKMEVIKQQNQKYNNYECRIKEIRGKVQGEGLLKKALLMQMIEKAEYILVCEDGSLKLTP